MKDISTNQDVEHLVDTFYGRVLKDENLAPFFSNLNFEIHMPKMVHFWSFVLLDEPGYTTNVTDKHMHMPLSKEHFDRWVELFHSTVNELFAGEKAEMAKQRATLIAWTIQNKTGVK
jgi:hemoglobin